MLETSENLYHFLYFSYWLDLTSGEGDGTPLQYSCLENPIDIGAWWAAVHGVAKSRTRLKWLSSSSRLDQYSCLENPMDRGAWQTMGSQRIGHDWETTSWCVRLDQQFSSESWHDHFLSSKGQKIKMASYRVELYIWMIWKGFFVLHYRFGLGIGLSLLVGSQMKQ